MRWTALVIYTDTRGVLEFDSSEVSAGRESGVLGLQAHLGPKPSTNPSASTSTCSEAVGVRRTVLEQVGAGLAVICAECRT